nr:reverse transcriptase domain-containing protein [Tanacetum cinerariifolium]
MVVPMNYNPKGKVFNSFALSFSSAPLPRVDPTLLNDFEMATNRKGDDVPPPGGGETFMKRRPEECYDLIKNMTVHHNDWDTSDQRKLKGTTTRSRNAYKGPTIPTTSSLPKVVERETEVTKDTMPPTNNESIKDVQPPVVQVKTQIPNSKPIVAPVVEPIVSSVSASKPNRKPSIPYPSRLHDQKLRDKTNDQKEKFFKIFQDLDFNISFVDALILMPKFGPTIKSLLTNKEKLFELARTPLKEHCSAVLLKKLPEKLGDPDKFLIPCDLSRMDECLPLADLGVSINLMPLSMWNKLSLPELSPTYMTLELADRLISCLAGFAVDVFVKTGRALIDVYEGELTIRVGKEAVTFNLDQTSRYSANYDTMSVNRIDLIDVACEEYSQEVFGFSVSGNPTPFTEPIVFTSSPTLTLFGE